MLPAGDYARSGYSLPENHPPDIFEDNIFPGIWTKVFERPSNRYLEGGFLYSLCPGQGVGAFPENFEPFYNYFTCSVQLCDGRVFFSLICLIKLVMNKDMIFDADGQAAQTELKDQRKGAVRYMIKTYVIDTNVLIQAPYAIKRL